MAVSVPIAVGSWVAISALTTAGGSAAACV